MPLGVVLSQQQEGGRGNTDTRPKRTRADYKESLIVCCIMTTQKEKESPSQPLQNTFSRAGSEVDGKILVFGLLRACVIPAWAQDASRYITGKKCGHMYTRTLYS